LTFAYQREKESYHHEKRDGIFRRSGEMRLGAPRLRSDHGNELGGVSRSKKKIQLAPGSSDRKEDRIARDINTSPRSLATIQE